MRHLVASAREVREGGAITVDVGDKRIAIFRNEGEFFALDETCPHRGGPLHMGWIERGVLFCPWHQWQFELRSGCSPLNPLSKVRTYAVCLEGDNLYLELDE